MSRNIIVLPASTMVVTRVSMLMIWVLDVVRYAMHLMLLIGLLGGARGLVNVICKGREEGFISRNAGFRPWIGVLDGKERKRQGNLQRKGIKTHT